MAEEKSTKYERLIQKSMVLGALGIAALSGFVGFIGYQAGKLEGRAELYRDAAYRIVDKNKNGIIEDTEFAALARELPTYDNHSTPDSTTILTRDKMQQRIDGVSNYAWQRFVDKHKDISSRL